MENGRKIMYVGNQFVPSLDRPNNRPDRVWNGPGSVVEGVPPIQAHALLVHPEEWRDVTDLSGAELIKAQQDARAASEQRVRVLKNPVDAPGNKRNVDAMSDEDLRGELDRRQREKAAAASAPRAKGLAGVTRAPREDQVPRSETRITAAVAKVVEGIMERIAGDGDMAKELLNEDGIPTFAAVQEGLGFQITEDDYRIALGLDVGEREVAAT